MRGAVESAKNAATTAAQTGSQYGRQASDISSTLVPQLTQEAQHPTGINPTDLNSMLVAGEQGAGGANAGVAGQAGLTAARTRNTGALSGVLDEAARSKGRTLSQNALGVQGENAQTKLKQQQAGLTGLEGLYGKDVSAGLEAQGLVPKDVEAEAKANQTGWLQNMMGIWEQINNSAKAFGGGS